MYILGIDFVFPGRTASAIDDEAISLVPEVD